MAEPIPLNQARRNRQSANRPPNDAEPPDDDLPSSCPVTVLGHLDGNFWFLDAVGQVRNLSASQLSRRGDIVALFGGDEGVAWLNAKFPRKIIRKIQTVNGEEYSESIQGFLASGVSDYLITEAKRAGLFGAHIRIRKPGIWPGAGEIPVVHCGDAVIIDGECLAPGQWIGREIFAAAAPHSRPGMPADASVALDMLADIKTLWNFRTPGGEIILIGLIGLGYFGAAIPWRSNGFLIGKPGSGKSMLLDLLRAAAPMHHFSTDTSKAGLEQAVNGNAMQIFVDEASDRMDQRGAQALMDIVLSATGGEGTKGHRGSAGGIVRTIEIVGAIIMSAVSPPTMQPQHEARFTMVELMVPDEGVDHRLEMQRAIRRARDAGPALWGRAVHGVARYTKALEAFRNALNQAGCAPREMDQQGAILAGWWVLTEDGVPDERAARIGVAAIAEFIRKSVDVAEDDSSRRMLNYLLSSLVSLERSTDQESIGTLIQKAFEPFEQENSTARKILARYGIRCVRFDEHHDARNMVIPRGSEGDGIWFANGAEPLKALFKNSPFDGDRWKFELARLETARKSVATVRIGGLRPGRAIWVSRYDVVGETNDHVT